MSPAITFTTSTLTTTTMSIIASLSTTTTSIATNIPTLTITVLLHLPLVQFGLTRIAILPTITTTSIH